MIFNRKCTKDDVIRAADNLISRIASDAFDPGLYVWRLGVALRRLILDSQAYLAKDPDCRDIFFGIDVEPDFHNPYVMKLFKDITE